MIVLYLKITMKYQAVNSEDTDNRYCCHCQNLELYQFYIAVTKLLDFDDKSS